MPSLILFKRRWLTGSDDFVLPGILLCLTHFILFVTATVFVSSSPELDRWSAYDPDEIIQRNANQSSIDLAKCANEIRVYSFLFVALLVFAILLEIILTGFSMQGTVVDSEPRKPVEYIVYGRSFLGVLEIIFSIAASVHLTRLWGQCSSFQHILALEHRNAVSTSKWVIISIPSDAGEAEPSLQEHSNVLKSTDFIISVKRSRHNARNFDHQAIGIIIVNFSFLLILIMIAICTFDSSGHTFYKLKMAKTGAVSHEHLNSIMTKFDEYSRNTWNRRLRRCCCCVRDTSNTNIALDEVSHLLRDFFKDLDVVPSDILAGMVLLRHKQQCIASKKLAADNEIDDYFCGRPIKNDSKFIDPCSPEESANYQNLIYHCHYAIAAYGSLFYMVYHPVTGFWKVLDQCLCKGRCCHGDRNPTTIVEDDKCCDWETAAVMKSLMENLNNSVLVYASWKNDLYEQPFFVCVDFEKKAIVVTIRGTVSEMDALTDIVATPDVIPVDDNDGSWKAHKGMIRAANYMKNRLVHDGILEEAFSYDSERGTRQFQLVFVGHSLGAGVAAILSIMMRPLFPHLFCYSYSPPGGLLSLSAVEASKHYIHSAVYGKDLVIRSGIRQLLKMRVDMVNLLRRSNKPKYQIIFGNPCKATQERHSLFGVGSNPNSDEQLLTHPELLGGCENLYPPGRILHIVYRSQESSHFCFKRSPGPKSYYAIEANNKDDFDEILISHNMVMHHWPQELLKAMKKVLNTSLPGDNTIKYSRSVTMPSSAPMPSNQNEPCDLTNPNDVNIVTDSRSDASHPVRGSKETSSPQVFLKPPLSKVDNNSSSNPATMQEDDQNQNFQFNFEGNINYCNNKNVTPPVEDAEESKEKDDDVSGTPLKYKRSNSMPHPPSRVAIDQDTFRRARFEANLIPKPPRTNSMRQSSPDQLKSRVILSSSTRTSSPDESADQSESDQTDDVKSALHDYVTTSSAIDYIDNAVIEDDVTDTAQKSEATANDVKITSPNEQNFQS